MTNTVTIYPTILTTTKEALAREIELAKAHFQTVQIDVADGILVENTTLTLEEILEVLDAHKDLEYDFHLMVRDYSAALATLSHSKLKIRYALIHHSAAPLPSLFVDNTFSFRLGLVANPDDTIETISHIYSLNIIPAIQIMTVYPGAQGRPFESKSLNLIDQLHECHYKGDIILDGAINDQTLHTILQRPHHPTVVGPGSYFSKSQNAKEYAQKYDDLKQIISSAIIA